MSRAVIFVNGQLPANEQARQLLRSQISKNDWIIAADGGTAHALALGLTPAAVVGDLDSFEVQLRDSLEAQNTVFNEHPWDKDETDFELALNLAVQKGCKRIMVVAALGGRLDQSLGNIALMADPALAHLQLRCEDGQEEVFFLRSGCLITGAAGDTVSLIPWGGDAGGIVTRGLKWNLRAENLSATRTRGISNVMTGSRAAVRIESGLVLVIHRRQRLPQSIGGKK